MRQIILLVSLIACIGLSANIKTLRIENVDTEKEIELMGSLISPQTRTVIKPILLLQQTECLRVNFNGSLGYISIYIYDDGGNLRYQKTVDTSIESQRYINVVDFETGNYSIEFVNSQSQNLIGNFVIQK